MIADVIIGLILIVVGLVLAAFPKPLVAAAPFWRIGMPGPASASLRAARAGAALLVIVGIVVAILA